MNKLFYIFLLLLSRHHLVEAQTPSGTNQLVCGTKGLKPDQAKALKQQAILALKKRMATNAAVTTLTYVPIRPHIIRKSNGTGGYPLANLNEAMATTNRYFLLNGFGIQFYFAGATPDYIDDDGLYESFGGYPANRDAHDALNQYYINVFSPELQQYGGLANYPADNIESTRSIIRTYGSDGDFFKWGFGLIPHELGHTFGLQHTFGYGSGEIPTDELVTRGPGANCQTAGDFICDTPADPYGISGANTTVVNGCYQYDPNSTARDANGEPYSPSITNLMSYYSSCTRDFTPGQIESMQAGLALRQSHTSYSLTAPATNVNPPSKLNLSFTNNSVVLVWQDNATNEMGYFIERSTSPTTGFVPVGGVAPNVTAFTDTQIALNTLYYYRIRPSNTILSNLSSTVSISTNTQPDLTLVLYARPSTVNNTTNINVVVDVVELNSVAAGGALTVQITKDARVNLTFPASATMINNRSVQNNAWTFNGTDPYYYIISTSQGVAAGDKLSFGLLGTLSPGATSGALAISSILIPSGITETRQTNNADADKIDYFQQ